MQVQSLAIENKVFLSFSLYTSWNHGGVDHILNIHSYIYLHACASILIALLSGLCVHVLIQKGSGFMRVLSNIVN